MSLVIIASFLFFVKKNDLFFLLFYFIFFQEKFYLRLSFFSKVKTFTMKRGSQMELKK